MPEFKAQITRLQGKGLRQRYNPPTCISYKAFFGFTVGQAFVVRRTKNALCRGGNWLKLLKQYFNTFKWHYSPFLAFVDAFIFCERKTRSCIRWRAVCPIVGCRLKYSYFVVLLRPKETFKPHLILSATSSIRFTRIPTIQQILATI